MSRLTRIMVTPEVDDVHLLEGTLLDHGRVKIVVDKDFVTDTRAEIRTILSGTKVGISVGRETEEGTRAIVVVLNAKA